MEDAEATDKMGEMVGDGDDGEEIVWIKLEHFFMNISVGFLLMCACLIFP